MFPLKRENNRAKKNNTLVFKEMFLSSTKMLVEDGWLQVLWKVVPDAFG